MTYQLLKNNIIINHLYFRSHYWIEKKGKKRGNVLPGVSVIICLKSYFYNTIIHLVERKEWKRKDDIILI